MNAREPDLGVAGRSARREQRRRRQRRQDAAARRPTLLAWLLGPSAAEKRLLASERAWGQGAHGEEQVAEWLGRRCPGVLFLHDRRMPRSRANIDHIAVAASGVYVIDTKCHRGKVQVSRPLFGEPKLTVAGNNRTSMIDSLDRQVSVVAHALAERTPAVPIWGCMCFIAAPGLFADCGLPVVRTLKLKGYPLYRVGRLARRLNRAGPLAEPEQIRSVHSALARRLPAA
jgi:Nuclease-related domain